MRKFSCIEEAIETVWKTARARCPELPETYEEANDSTVPLGIYEADHLGKVMLIKGNGNMCAVLSFDGSMDVISADEVYYTGRTIPLEDFLKGYLLGEVKKTEHEEEADPVESLLSELNKRQAGGRKKPVLDPATGKRYDSISAWAKDNNLSPQSGMRLLRGEAESIKGHRLEPAV